MTTRISNPGKAESRTGRPARLQRARSHPLDSADGTEHDNLKGTSLRYSIHHDYLKGTRYSIHRVADLDAAAAGALSE